MSDYLRKVLGEMVTKAVTDHILRVANLAKWRDNLPITGDATVDIPKLREVITGMIRDGAAVTSYFTTSVGPNIPVHDSQGMMTWELAKIAEEYADYPYILTLWQPNSTILREWAMRLVDPDKYPHTESFSLAVDLEVERLLPQQPTENKETL